GYVETGAANSPCRNPSNPDCCTWLTSSGVGPNVACSSIRTAAAALTTVPPLTTCAVTEPEDTWPGFGFCTVIPILPTCAAVAVPVAVICVADTRFVVSAVVPKKTVAPCAKFVPATVSENAPTGIAAGVTEETCGTGLFSVTMLLALIAVLALSATVIVTVLGVGGN